MQRNERKRFPYQTLFLWVVGGLAVFQLFGCADTVQPIDLNRTPGAPVITGTRTESFGIRIAWNHVDGVNPGLFTSGYKVYVWSKRDSYFAPTEDLVIRNELDAPWPRIAATNSLSDTHMEVVVAPLIPGEAYKVYVTAIQNGHESVTSDTITDYPYARISGITVRDASRATYSFYLIGDTEETENYPVITHDRLGYVYDRDENKQYLLFQSRNDGGSLRIMKGTKDDEFNDPPFDSDGILVGHVLDPAADRIEIERGSVVFVWNTNGTSRMFDDHHARIIVRRIMDGKYMRIDCDYQPRENLPSL